MSMRTRFFRTFIAAAAMCVAVPAFANTWNEPWHQHVVEASDSLGLFRVEKVKGDSAVVTLEKQLGGVPVPKKLKISGYHMLDISSASSDDWSVWLEPKRSYYLLLKKSPAGKWQLPTPSAGSDEVRDNGEVAATFRHSAHKAQVPSEIYEMTQSCIFEVLHSRECASDDARKFVEEMTRKPVAVLGPGVAEDQAAVFFLQHAALETAALAQISISDDALKPFLRSDFFHVQASALMYVARSGGPDRSATVAAFVCSGENTAFARALGLLLLEELDARSQAPTLKACAPTLDTEETFLVGDIMDPRVGTVFPGSLRDGATALLTKWNAL